MTRGVARGRDQLELEISVPKGAFLDQAGHQAAASACAGGQRMRQNLEIPSFLQVARAAYMIGMVVRQQGRGGDPTRLRLAL